MVIISQNGRVIKQVKVAPVDLIFKILLKRYKALYVTIEEEDGSKTTYQVTAASLPFLNSSGPTAL
ncbi:fimbria/pilus outer membrane usher protein [Providencia hangzhouensis]|uniref:fimbria/pilus outer membrane usher protein n=1 Tax=Providencia hangzhouensis TaxID=3031799 RepID=UPI0034DD83B2